MNLAALRLHNFRNYAAADLPDLPASLVAFVGPNGAGKTSLLEAISLLLPGRGLRGADTSAPQRQGSDASTSPWAVHARLNGPYGPQSVGLSWDPGTTRRIAHLNGEAVRGLSALSDLIRCIWLTPAQDRLFQESAATRRRFLDRWVFTVDPAHAGRVNRYDRLLTQRNHLLAMPRPDPAWLTTIEKDLAETGMAIAVARADYADRLRQVLDQKEDGSDFPHATLSLRGGLEDRIGQAPSLAIEQNFIASLAENRDKDRAAGATTIGPHRSDLAVSYSEKKTPADQCSTGEQKALLFSLFLAHARLLTRTFGTPPVLLLDEVAAHLDDRRRAALFERLDVMGGQVFVTATDAALIPRTHRPSAVFDIQNGFLQTKDLAA